MDHKKTAEPTSHFLVLENGQSIVRIDAPCSNSHTVFIRKIKKQSHKLGVLKEAMLAPLVLNDQIEIFGVREEDAMRIRAETELLKDLTYLVAERQFSQKPTSSGLEYRKIYIKNEQTLRLADDLAAAGRVSEGLDRLPQFKLPEEAASYSHQDVSNYLTGWLMLAGIASVLYLIFGSPLGVGGVSVLLSYSDLILPTLLMTIVSALVLAGLPLLFLRKSPFTLPILQTWGKSFWFFALATGLASAISLDMLVPEQQVTVRYAGELHSTSRKQGSHYYLQAVEASAPVAFGESVRYIPLTRQQYETLSGLQDNERGVFDATFDQGVLFAPYVVKVKRVRTDNFTQ